jgi:hypothetical protein
MGRGLAGLAAAKTPIVSRNGKKGFSEKGLDLCLPDVHTAPGPNAIGLSESNLTNFKIL